MFSRKPKSTGIFDLIEQAKKTVWPAQLRLPLPPAKPGETILGKAPASVHGMLYLSMLHDKKAEELMLEAKWAADEDHRKAILEEVSEKTRLGKQLMDMFWTEVRAQLVNSDKPTPNAIALRQDMMIVESSGCADGVPEMLKELLGSELPDELLAGMFSGRGRHVHV